jgi:uncharacterized damage-inducible protein DinB
MTERPTTNVEVWLRGPIPGIIPELQSTAHALLQALEDIERATAALPRGATWTTPNGVASIGFHLRHLAGSTERLFAAAVGRDIDQRQRADLERERLADDEELESLSARLRAAVERTLEGFATVTRDDLGAARHLGRKQIPTTTGDLLHHIGHHAARHSGQVVTTAKFLGVDSGVG